MKRALPVKPKRIVVKVGTGILTTGDFHLDKARAKRLVRQIAVLNKRGVQTLLVTSGAIGAGMGMLKLKTRPRSLPQQQAAAAIGQSRLMRLYDTLFKQHNLLSAQILLTREDLSNRKRYLNARNTLLTLLNYGAVCIINENDTVSVDEIKFGDNDRLSALVVNLVQADLLIILSDVDGLYHAPGRKAVFSVVEKISPEITKHATPKTGRAGTGGMTSKIEAARICSAAGVGCIVANGRQEQILLKLLDEQDLGTLFLPGREKLVAKKRWIGFSAKINGQIFVDEGAKQALLAKRRSLLPKGITRIRGNFSLGDTVAILDPQGREFARGLANYSAEQVEKIKGRKTEEIKDILGYKDYDEVVHRDNLAVL